MSAPTPAHPSAPAASDLLRLAVEIAAGGAMLAARIRAEAITRVRTKSTDTDMVTGADHAVERYVVDVLRAARPDDAVRRGPGRRVL